MNLNTITHNDGSLFDDPDIAEALASKRRNRPLSFTIIKKLVQALKPGMERQANLERYGQHWRLRFSLRSGDGKYTRRSIVIEDVLTAGWVRDYLQHARGERQAFKHEMAVKEHRKRWLEAGVDPEILLSRRLSPTKTE